MDRRSSWYDRWKSSPPPGWPCHSDALSNSLSATWSPPAHPRSPSRNSPCLCKFVTELLVTSEAEVLLANVLLDHARRVLLVQTRQAQDPGPCLQVLVLPEFHQELEQHQQKLAAVVLLHLKRVLLCPVPFLQVAIESAPELGQVHHFFLLLPLVYILLLLILNLKKIMITFSFVMNTFDVSLRDSGSISSKNSKTSSQKLGRLNITCIAEFK